MRILKVPSWFLRLFRGGFFFLFVWTTYLVLKKRSLDTRFRICCILATIIYWFYRNGRKRITRNISLIRPDLNEIQIAKGRWQVVRTIARSWAAMLGNESTTLEEIAGKLKIEGEIEQLLSSHRTGKKIIATMVHTGPVDEMVGIIPLLGLQIYVPAEPVKPKWFFNLMMRLRLRFEGIVYEPVEKGQTLARAARHLSEGRIVLLAVDLPRREGGVLCRIGNARAIFPVGSVKLALEQDATIFPVFPSWEENWIVKVKIGAPFVLIKTGNIEEDIRTNTRRLIGIYKDHIQENWWSWLRLLWSEFEEVEANVAEKTF